MSTLECLACGHGNRPGDESCAACSSVLTLELCGACEAINDSCADRCHGCGARLRPERQREAPPARRAVLRPKLWIVPLLAAVGFGYYFFGATEARPVQGPTEARGAGKVESAACRPLDAEARSSRPACR